MTKKAERAQEETRRESFLDQAVRLFSGSFGAVLLPVIGLLIGSAFKNPLVGTLLGVGTSLAFARNELMSKMQNITEVSNLYAQVERCGVDNQSIVSLMKAATHVDRERFDGLPLRFVNCQINDLTNTLAEFGNLTASKRGAQMDWMIDLARLSKQSIKAVSTMAADGDLWDDPVSRSYLRPQIELAQRVGAGAVRRIFVVPVGLRSGGALASGTEVMDVMTRQDADGIQVRYLFEDEYDGEILDVVIFDDEMAVTSVLERRGAISSTSVSARRADVVEKCATFDEMWAVSHAFANQSQGWGGSNG